MANMLEDDQSGDIVLIPAKSNPDENSERDDEADNIHSKQDKELEFTYRLSQEDMIVLNNIVKLSLVIIIVSVAVIIVGILMQFTAVLTNQIVKFH
jgi:hypothetical protein